MMHLRDARFPLVSERLRMDGLDLWASWRTPVTCQDTFTPDLLVLMVKLPLVTSDAIQTWAGWPIVVSHTPDIVPHLPGYLPLTLAKDLSESVLRERDKDSISPNGMSVIACSAMLEGACVPHQSRPTIR